MNLDELIPNTQMLHAIASHMPVALSVVGVLAVLAGLFIRTQRDALKWSAVGLYLLMIGSAFVAEETGEDARSELSASLSKEVWDIVGEHAEMAEYIWIFGAITAALLAISALSTNGIKTAFGILALVASIATAGWVAFTGHHGGELVYEHGIGINPDQFVDWRIDPPASSNVPPPAVPEADLIPIFDIDPVEAAKISYVRDVKPIFDEVCVECHKPGDLDSEYDMTTVELIIGGGEKYDVSVIPGKPDESTLIKYVRGSLQPQMPEDEMPLLKAEVHILRQWIYAGAKDDS